MFDVHVQYFAVLREKKGVPSETVNCISGTTVDALYQRLFGAFAQHLVVSYAVNRAQVSKDTLLSAGDEVVFLPPMGGG